ncbi:cullin-1 isoform X2 [Populus trichocarpa]|uniref:cullin-1 isoform X2 n=1 Tax=Populus trichocarpa TaxID=3694 RepID=UPI002278FE9D|nr:cullin-1 isoform X2 [Populus trichocarpa]
MSMTTADVKSSERFEEGMVVIQEAVDRAIGIAEGTDNVQGFSSEDYMRYYTTIYELSTPNPLGEYSRELYDYYKKIFEEYITSKVLPALNGKRDQDLLQEIVRRWSILKTMTLWLFRFFNYLDRYFIARRKLPSLQQTSYNTFYNLVYAETFGPVKDAVIAMINREREGEQIDQALVKSILAINAENGVGSLKQHKQNLEEAILKDTAAFYSQKASYWMQKKSYNEYMLAVSQCLTHEKDTVSPYLQAENQKKLLEVVEQELLNAHANELERKKQVDEFPLADRKQVNLQ